MLPSQQQYESALQKYKGKLEVTLTKIVQISHDSYIKTFSLPEPNLTLGLQVGQHIKILAKVSTKKNPKGKWIKRSYTPTSAPNQVGTFDLLYKVYRRGVHPKYPEGGILTQYLESLQIGDKIKIVGPTSKFVYLGHGKFKLGNMAEFKVERLGLICGGTGIAVMYPIVKKILDDPTDKTTVNLLFTNRTEQDILLRSELETAASDPRFKIYYSLDNPPAEWQGFTDYVTKEMIQKTMPAPSRDTFMWVCGSKAMDKMVGGQFAELNYPRDRSFGVRGIFYINLLTSNFFRSIKNLFTCQCCRKKSEIHDD